MAEDSAGDTDSPVASVAREQSAAFSQGAASLSAPEPAVIEEEDAVDRDERGQATESLPTSQSRAEEEAAASEQGPQADAELQGAAAITAAATTPDEAVLPGVASTAGLESEEPSTKEYASVAPVLVLDEVAADPHSLSPESEIVDAVSGPPVEAPSLDVDTQAEAVLSPGSITGTVEGTPATVGCPPVLATMEEAPKTTRVVDGGNSDAAPGNAKASEALVKEEMKQPENHVELQQPADAAEPGLPGAEDEGEVTSNELATTAKDAPRVPQAEIIDTGVAAAAHADETPAVDAPSLEHKLQVSEDAQATLGAEVNVVDVAHSIHAVYPVSADEATIEPVAAPLAEDISGV